MAKIKINKSGTVINKSARYKEIVKCGEDPKYFIKKYIKISHPTKGLIKFELFPFQEECLDAFVDHKKIIINKSRQLGLSTLAAAYSLWMALFHRERNVLVIATKLDVAKNFIRKVNANLEGLPDWLVLPKKTAQSVKYIQFSNGSQIKAIPTSAASVRSEAVSILICDEAAHVDGIDELWLGLQPTLSCLSGDTLVLTDDGFVRIEDFHKNKNIGDYFDLEIPVYGKYGMELTSKGYVSPESETLIVRTKHGHKVEATLKHPLYALQADGLGKMIQTQNLNLGDYLRIEVGQNCFGKTKLHPDMAYMLGGYIAEGWVAKRKNKKTGVIEYDSVEVENQDDDFRDVFLKSTSLKKNFTIVPSRKTRLRCSSRELVKELKILGVNPDLYCHNKVTPNSILQGDRGTVTNYLSGLFDGDGNVSERHISLSSTSEKLIRETSLLLHNLGFVSNIQHIPAKLKDIGRIMPQGRPLQSLRDSWVVSVAKSQYKKFYEEIGFRIKRKNDNLLKLSQLYIQDNAKLQKIPIIKIKNKFQYFINKSGYTKNWFYEQGIRFDRKSNGKINQNVTKNFLLKLKTILTEKAGLILTEEDELFFNENIGSFYWDEIVSLEKSYNKTYDFTVPKTHSFLQNGILGSNTGGSAILISSPAGVGNLFHRLWVDAKESPNKKREGKNGFFPIELPWTVHPERDQDWFNAQRAEIITATGERGVGMELLCNFASSGDTFIKGETLDDLMNSVRPPVSIQPHGRDEVWVWETPKITNKYIISADVSRGDADDFSTFSIIDTNENEVVADFKGKLPPDRFADLLVMYGKVYNNALICQELNAVGAACATQLKTSKYPNLFYEKFQKNMYMSYVTQDVEDEFPGYTMAANTRIELLAKLEATIRNRKVKLYSKRLFEELQTFIWKNNKPQAQKGYNDDLIMSLAIGCGLYEPDGNNGAHGDLQEALALLRGMSRESKTINPYSGDQKIHNKSTTTADGMWRKKNNGNAASGNGLHNYNDERWRHFDWVFKD